MISKVYDIVLVAGTKAIEWTIPYFRRCLRFLALPYCYFIVNWEDCTSNRLQVVKDFLYIFFKLKYYPDNYSMCRLWEKDREQWALYYGSIYNPYPRARLRKDVQKKDYQILFNDKEVCFKLCYASNLPVPNQFGFISPQVDYKKIIRKTFTNNNKKIMIIKPVMGKGGRGICQVSDENGEILIKRYQNKEVVTERLEQFVLKERAMIQECVLQHEALSDIYRFSVNTIRAVTLLTKKHDVLILGALIRFGIHNAFVDNTCKGGIGVGIDIETGLLKQIGYDKNGKIFIRHPDSKVTFDAYPIPHWPSVISLAKSVQKSFTYYKLLGLDIAVRKNGPLLMEINASHDNVGFEQKSGPILANQRVRKEFFRYNLLINKIQKIV